MEILKAQQNSVTIVYFPKKKEDFSNHANIAIFPGKRKTLQAAASSSRKVPSPRSVFIHSFISSLNLRDKKGEREAEPATVTPGPFGGPPFNRRWQDRTDSRGRLAGFFQDFGCCTRNLRAGWIPLCVARARLVFVLCSPE